ncbi:MAG: hypothetical protein KatS3mg123_0642 [Burkholderiales bacterium]|nr:MAG: hypothetical protein KatS3mg123_0642 [Burkholderiales bacterium]
MWDMFLNSLKLFFKGKLFRDPRAVFRKWLIGFLASLIAVIVLAKAGLPIGWTVAIAALGTGLLQPYLFKDLKYN